MEGKNSEKRAPVPTPPPHPVKLDRRDAIHGCTGARGFEGSALEISWACHDDGRAVTGRLWLAPGGPEQRFALDEKHPEVQLQLVPKPRWPQGRIWLTQGSRSAILSGDLQLSASLIFDDAIADWPIAGPPAPGDTPQENAGVVIGDPRIEHDVFPFLVTGAPLPPAHLDGPCGRRFIRCPDPTSLALYQKLAGDRAAGGAGMVGDAQTFMASAAFVGAPSALPSGFLQLAAQLFALPGAVTLEALNELVKSALGVTAAELLAEPAAQAARGDLWQSAFALALASPAPPPSPPLDPAAMILGVRLFDVLEGIAAGRPELLDERARREALSARAVLPEAVTPPAAAATAAGWAEVLGPGRLQVIRQRLVGYDAGEVALTVNVMPRERRITTDRSLTRREEGERTRDRESTAERRDEGSEGRSELHRELADLLAATSICRHCDDKKTADGDGVSFTFGGTKTETRSPASRRARRAADFAERVTRLAESRIARRAARDQRRQLVEEQERIRRTDLDNRAGAGRQVGIYRWLRRIYAVSLADLGRRLIVELLVPSPAAGYLKRVEASGAPLAPPTPPPVSAPAEVTPSNYRSLAAQYDAEIPPPPQASRVVTAGFQSGGAGDPGAIVVPEGHAANHAVAAVLVSDKSFSLVGQIGDWAFSVPGAPADPQPARAAAPAAGDPAPCQAPPDPFTPPTPPSPTQTTLDSALPVKPSGPTTGRLPISFVCAAPAFSVSVAVTCALDDYADALAAWQVGAYHAVLAGYDAQLAAYRAVRDERVAVTSRDRRRAIEAEALQAGGLTILWARHQGAELDEPAYLRFFDRAFAWKEMAYELYAWGVGAPEPTRGRWAGEALRDPESDALFARFLTAGSARVLCPVTPGEELAVLFYFTYGRLPPWRTDDVPVPEPLVLAACTRCADAEAQVEAPWTLEIPTSHLVLQDGPELPRFER